MYTINNQFHNIYTEIVKDLLDNGKRAWKTRERLFLNFILTQPMNNQIVLDKNWAWCYTELIDRLTGQNPGSSYLFRPKWARKLEAEGGLYCYSYASIFAEQLPKIMKVISKNYDREAIISVWESKYLDRKAYRRRPCTISTHFYNENGTLHLFVNMRSSDVINMLPYDVFLHCNLLIYIASILGLKLGHYHHTTSQYYWPKRRDLRNYGAKLYKMLKENNSKLIDSTSSFPLIKPQESIILARKQLDDIITGYDINPDNIPDPTIRTYIKSIYENYKKRNFKQ